MPQFASGVRFAVVSTLPAAASSAGVVLEQGGKLWFSDGAAWVDLGADGSATWGAITGALSAQADLQAALDAKEAAGVAASTMAAHVAAGDPHPQYLTPAEASAAYAAAAHDHAIAQVTGLQTVLDGKASASAVQALEGLGHGTNLLTNTLFARNLDGWELFWNQLGGSVNMYRQPGTGDAGVPDNMNALINIAAATASVGVVLFGHVRPIPAIPGRRYFASLYISGFPAGAWIRFDDASGVPISEQYGEVTGNVPGGESLDLYARPSVSLIAPAGTANVRYGFYHHTSTSGSAFIRVLNPMLEECSQTTQAAPSPFNSGGAEFLGTIDAHEGAADPHPQYTTQADIALVDRTFLTDSRGASRAPNFYDGRFAQWDFQQNIDTQAGGDVWHGLLTVHPWTGYNEHHRQQQIAFTGTGGLRFRYATSETTWGAWQTVWTSGNFNPDSKLDDSQASAAGLALLGAADAAAQRTLLDVAPLAAGTATGRAATWNNGASRWEEGADVLDSRGNLRSVPVNTQNGAYTFLAADNGRKVMKDGATAITYTLPTGLASGTTIVVRNKNAAGNITISRSGTTLRIAGSGTNANATIAPWGEALLHHEGGEEWVISGTGVT